MDADRPKEAATTTLYLRPTHVPVVRHHSQWCPECLAIAEVGPTDAQGNRALAAITGFGVSEGEMLTDNRIRRDR
jgi:hypothetical protein